jgi:hypothetical protein
VKRALDCLYTYGANFCQRLFRWIAARAIEAAKGHHDGSMLEPPAGMDFTDFT